VAPSNQTRTVLLAIGGGIASVLVISLLLYLAVANHALIFSHSTVKVLGSSMEPTLHDGQAVTLDWSAYRQHGPAHGDLVLFLSPAGESIKRVVAIPGDRLHIAAGTVFINEQPVNESFLAEPWTYNNRWPASGRDVQVPPGEYFLLGDNRNHSSDSRAFGFVALDSIFGQILTN
jgi:signal peptidase I